VIKNINIYLQLIHQWGRFI